MFVTVLNMVLSNKKLKEKLRAALASAAQHTLAAETTTSISRKGDAAETIVINSKEAGGQTSLKCGSTPIQVQELLSSASKRRSTLSKREKRRKMKESSNGGIQEEVTPMQNKENTTSEENTNSNSSKKKKKKKRKTEEDKGAQMEDEDAQMEDGHIDANRSKKKKKQKQKRESGQVAGDAQKDTQSAAPTDIVINANESTVPESQESEYEAQKVYVGGIPYYSNEDDIRSFFEGCGTITEVDCMKFPESGKFRGIALITFKTEAAAKRALALDGADMGGLYLKIQQCRSCRSLKNDKQTDFEPSKVDGSNRAYIGNLAWDITEDDLKELFIDCKISAIRFGKDKTTGEFRGYGHIDFADDLSLAMALKLDQEVVCGRPIKIAYAVPKSDMKQSDSDKTTSRTKKSKRRTCYICSQPGHLSSSCPQKQSAE
eukprot:Gb_35169 [translate_table: standard]